MALRVVEINERGGAIMWTHGFVPRLMSRIQVMGEFISRRNHCA